MLARLMTLTLCSGLLLLAGGCDPCAGMMCGACPSAIMLDVVDEDTGAPVTGVTIAGAVGGCDEMPTRTTCNLGTTSGTYELTVDASGYEPASLSITVPSDPDDGCCSCGFQWVSDTVALTPSVP